MGFLTGFPRYVLVQFKDSGTHVGETTLIDFDESEEFNYEEEYVVFWPDRPMATKAKPGEKKKKKYAAKILLFSGKSDLFVLSLLSCLSLSLNIDSFANYCVEIFMFNADIECPYHSV